MLHTRTVPSQVHGSQFTSRPRRGFLRQALLATALSLLSAFASGADGWAYYSGSGLPTRDPIYGTIGVPSPQNTPGARTGSATWSDASGNLWMFGGNLYGSTEGGLCNDMWKYNAATNQWTWLKGKDFTDFIGIYGTKGVPAANNNPGSRHVASTWMDATGNLWLFGGIGYDKTGPTAVLNDLWKYDPATNNWTWITGSDTSLATGVYGTKGTEAAANTPGARNSAASWKDASGNFWLFGGEGRSIGTGQGLLHDVWKFNIANNRWTWIGGTTNQDETAITGTQGVPDPDNLPGGMSSMSYWSDASGNFWMYGGFGYPGFSFGDWLNDLWKYNPATNEWTWISGNYNLDPAGVYGTKGVESPTNRPGGRAGSGGWADSSGNFWIYAGFGYGADTSDLDYLADLWKYSTASGQWTWVGGDNTSDVPPFYGTQGTPTAQTKPGSRSDSQYWKSATPNEIWLYSGTMTLTTDTQIAWPDMWIYNMATNQWTWESGPRGTPNAGIYNTLGVPNSSSIPGSRQDAMAWTAADQTLWMMGGNGYDSAATGGLLNDVWQYNPANSTWTWMKGSNLASPNGTYGTKGTPAAANTPSGRYNSITWRTNDGNFWLLGGQTMRYISGNPGNIRRNDLWRFNPGTRQWTWMAGGNLNQDRGVYGTLETPTTATTPGAREGGHSWVDANGDLWLFGGLSTSDASATINIINDLWKYTMATGQWTWMGGSNAHSARGTYGTMGVPSASNIPGARRDGATWTDASGNFWLMGGYGYGESGSVDNQNDLWKYSPATKQWTWVHGSKIPKAHAVYGTKGVADPANTPGGRTDAVTWKDSDGIFYLYGGDSMLISGNFPHHTNDLWSFDPATSLWTWIAGSDEGDAFPVLGTPGVSDPLNTPGARKGMVCWTTNADEFWMFSGMNSFTAEYNDMWHYKREETVSAASDWQLFE